MTDLNEPDDAGLERTLGRPGEAEESGGLDSEERARLQGWKPLAEYRGDPERWRDAKEFLEISERSAPLLKEQLSRMERQVKHLTRANQAADERWRNQERERIRAELRSAAANGDEERADKLSDALERVSVPAPTNETPAEVDDFRQRNPWFGVDRTKTAEAQFLSSQVRQMNPDWSVADELKAVEDEMKRRYPAPGQAPRPRAAAPEQGSDGVRLAPQRASVFDKLPYAAKQSFSHMVERGVFPDTAEEREAYAKSYDSDSAVIVRSKRTA